jgi:hypothetical protein
LSTNSSSGTASLAILETLNIAQKSIDEMDRNVYKPRKMLTPAAGIDEYKTCGLEGFVPSANSKSACKAGSLRLVHTSTI